MGEEVAREGARGTGTRDGSRRKRQGDGSREKCFNGRGLEKRLQGQGWRAHRLMHNRSTILCCVQCLLRAPTRAGSHPLSPSFPLPTSSSLQVAASRPPLRLVPSSMCPCSLKSASSLRSTPGQTPTSPGPRSRLHGIVCVCTAHIRGITRSYYFVGCGAPSLGCWACPLGTGTAQWALGTWAVALGDQGSFLGTGAAGCCAPPRLGCVC